MNRRHLALVLLVGAAGCAPPPAEMGGPSPASWTAALPPDAVQGAGDPGRAALTRAAYAFNQPAVLARNPADAARAIADAEFLAVELAGPRWTGMPLAATQMAGARPEWRAAVGIAPNAPPQAVIDALYAARRALVAGDNPAAAAALRAPAFAPGGAATLERLAALPPLPRTAAAASKAERESVRAAMDGRSRLRGRR